MSRSCAFLSREDGAISVDWVVLTAIATATAMGTVGILSSGVKTANHEVEVQMGLAASAGDTWGAAMRDYIPYSETNHTVLHTGLSTLSRDDLDTMSDFLMSFVADQTDTAEGADEHGALNDISFATGLANSERGEARPTADTTDPDEIARIASQLGWSTIPGTDYALTTETSPDPMAGTGGDQAPAPEEDDEPIVNASVDTSDDPTDTSTDGGGQTFAEWLAALLAYLYGN
ncbi:hypothetical protein [Jannaschia sp. 2305UL9-9]|uniref:hypothetical protein n=1 Tax=Jannaschia sp. 2305UL9-9 TaxID=3121638 RepID=UPI003527CF77